jgi:membrane protein DedA with SNARE-associated domain
MVAALIGATLGDISAIPLGCWKDGILLARFPAIAKYAPRVHALHERNDDLFIIGVRFFYGLRIVGPIVIGTSGVRFCVSMFIIWSARLFGRCS